MIRNDQNPISVRDWYPCLPITLIFLPLSQGYGVFAKQRIPDRIFLCRYPGEMITEDKFDEDVAAGKRKEDNFVYSLKLNGKCYWYVVLFINYRFGYVIIREEK